MFLLSAVDNDLYFFRGRADVTRCQKCGQLTRKWEEDLASIPLSPPPKLDISYSPDGVLVASPRFQAAVVESGATGLDFRLLRSGFFAVRSIAAVPFDAERRRTRFENRCDACGQFESVVGANPVFLKAEARVPENGFVRTDLEFGSDDEKSPLELCGNDIGACLRRAKLRGIDLMAAEPNVVG